MNRRQALVGFQRKSKVADYRWKNPEQQEFMVSFRTRIMIRVKTSFRIRIRICVCNRIRF